VFAGKKENEVLQLSCGETQILCFLWGILCVLGP
jgi:hypothetical protein